MDGDDRTQATSTLDPTARALMRDEGAERELTERGYTLVDLLDADEVADLRDFYRDHARAGDLNPEGAYNPTYAEFTTMNSRSSFREAAFGRITAVTQAPVDRHLVDCRPVVANYVNKPPGGGLVPVHQNMSVVDETRARSVSVWIALVDCTEDNGTIQFVDGSHHRFRGRRGTWAYQEFGEIPEETIAELFTPVSIRAGQAIVLDDAIIHYSAPNRHPDPRLAIQLVMAPAEEESLYYQVAAEHDDRLDLDVFAVEPDFFFDFWGGVGSLGDHAQSRGHLTIERTRHDERSLRSAVEPTATSPVAEPAPGDAERTYSAPGRLVAWARRLRGRRP